MRVGFSALLFSCFHKGEARHHSSLRLSAAADRDLMKIFDVYGKNLH